MIHMKHQDLFSQKIKIYIKKHLSSTAAMIVGFKG